MANRSADRVTYTQPDSCATTMEIRRDGRRVGGGLEACAQIFVGTVTLPSHETRRLPVRFQALSDANGGSLPPGSYEAVAAVHASRADGTWAAPPVAFTVTP